MGVLVTWLLMRKRGRRYPEAVTGNIRATGPDDDTVDATVDASISGMDYMKANECYHRNIELREISDATYEA